jgi:hypothetical protein
MAEQQEGQLVDVRKDLEVQHHDVDSHNILRTALANSIVGFLSANVRPRHGDDPCFQRRQKERANRRTDKLRAAYGH